MSEALAAVLQRPDVWRGDTLPRTPVPAVPTGNAALDAALPGGGWPRGQLTELLPATEGIGELSLLLPALAAQGAAGRAVVLLAPPHALHAPAWHQAGVPLSSLHVVNPSGARARLWAACQILRCPESGATLLWLEQERHDLGLPVLRQLQAAAQAGGGLAFLFRPAAARPRASPAPLRLQLARAGGGLQIDIFKRRGAALGQPLHLRVGHPFDDAQADALARPRPAYAPGLLHLA